MSQRVVVRRSVRRSPVPPARRLAGGYGSMSSKLDGARARLAKLRAK